MHEVPNPPRFVDLNDYDEQRKADSVPGYRAALPKNSEAFEQERQDLSLERENKNRGANVLMVLGMCCGAAAFVLPLNSCSAQLGGPSSLNAAMNAFVGTLIACVALGVIFGSIAASMRARVRFIDSRLRALDAEEQRLFGHVATKLNQDLDR